MSVRAPEEATPLRAILLILATTSVFALADAITKYLTADYPPVQILWARNLFQLVAMAAFLYKRRPIDVVRTGRLALQLMRGGLHVVSSLAFFVALAHIPLAEAVAIGYVSPLAVTALSVPILGERVRLRRWSAVVIGFAGALIIVRPGLGLVHWAAMLPLVSALFYALYQIVTRILGTTEHPATTLFYTTAVGVVVTSLMVPFTWAPASAELWGIAAVIGGLGALGQWLLIRAFAYAPASALAPFGYAGILVAALLGFALFGDVPDRWTLIGTTILILSGLYVIYRETALARARAAARP